MIRDMFIVCTSNMPHSIVTGYLIFILLFDIALFSMFGHNYGQDDELINPKTYIPNLPTYQLPTYLPMSNLHTYRSSSFLNDIAICTNIDFFCKINN